MEDLPEFITETDNGVTVALNKPLLIDGAKVSCISMREPTVADQMAMERTKGTDGEKEIQMMANLCMITKEQISSLTLKDYSRVQKAFRLFID